MAALPIEVRREKLKMVAEVALEIAHLSIIMINKKKWLSSVMMIQMKRSKIIEGSDLTNKR
jgi:hypothetical protein